MLNIPIFYTIGSNIAVKSAYALTALCSTGRFSVRISETRLEELGKLERIQWHHRELNP
jgi:hypothetical protein